MPNPKLVLIDGHSLAFRAFHALPLDLTAPGGELTNAVFGFTSMLLNVLRDEEPEYVAVAFDVGRTFRDDLYAEYKGHRERTPTELESQVERIKEVVTALNIPIFTKAGFEADDVLATLARQAEAQGVDTLIVTGDRDILQVVDERVSVLTSGRKFSDTIVYTPESVQERYELRPDQLVDLKAFLGDKSDNIPGVRGIGEKSAVALLQKYQTLEHVYAHLDEITPNRTQVALKEGEASAWLSQKLGRIITDVPIELNLEECRTRHFDRAKVVRLFQDLAFRTLATRLPETDGKAGLEATEVTEEAAGEPDAGMEQGAYAQFAEAAEPAAGEAGVTEVGPEGGAEGSIGQMSLFGEEGLPAEPHRGGVAPLLLDEAAGERLAVTSPERLSEVAEKLAAAPMFAFDTETTAIDPQSAELVGLALAWGRQPEEGVYVPLRHTGGTQLPWEAVRAVVQPLFADPKIKKVAHNASYDLSMLDRNGVPVAGELIDTMIAAWLIDPGSRGLGLKDQSWTRLKIEMTPITDLIGTGKSQITMDQVPVGQAARYASADAVTTLRLADLLLPELAEKKLTSLFYDVEMPLVPVLVAMESAGIRLDAPFLGQMSKELTARLQHLEGEIQQIVGYAFNINSTQQLSDVLFGKLGLPADGLKKTQAGSYSTAADVLEGLRGKHEIVDLILEQRQLSKLLSTYVNALPAMINARTGRLHTSFNQAGAETGRLSSSAPNLQNIPIRTDIGREIRKAFVAEDGCVLLSADYSQVELRILAHISGDPSLLAAFARGEDIHASAAAAVYGISLEQVTKAQRNVAKMMNFATSYGVSAFGLAQRTGLSRGDAQRSMERYFQTYPGVKRYLDETRAAATRLGYVETLLGRRRYFPVLRTTATGPRAYNARQAAERAAINHPIQGTAADIIKIAMVRLFKALKDGGYRAKMTLQVHDELVLEVPREELTAVSKLVEQTMEGAYELKAPLKVDAEAGPNWYDMTPVVS